MPSSRTTSSLTTRTPPEAIAPIASSSCPGTPILRTRNRSSGAPSAFATSYATGTPPRGKASTMTSDRPVYADSSAASCRPASLRSWKSMARPPSHAGRIRLGHFPRVPCLHVQRVQRPRPIEIHERIISLRHHRRDVVPVALVLRMIDDADRPMAAGIGNGLARRTVVEDQQAIVLASPVQHVFPTVLARFGDVHHLHRRFPLAGGDHTAPVRSEADYDCVSRPVIVADQLPDVDHIVVGHVRVPGVADVRIVLPDDRLGVGVVLFEEAVERVGHVAVADIPGFGTALDHGPVIRLGVLHDAGVLFGREPLVTAFAPGGRRLPDDLSQQLHDLSLARFRHPHGGAGVLLWVFAIWFEAADRAFSRFQRATVGPP